MSYLKKCPHSNVVQIDLNKVKTTADEGFAFNEAQAWISQFGTQDPQSYNRLLEDSLKIKNRISNLNETKIKKKLGIV